MAAVILLARYFAATKNNVRTLLFVTFAGEELGLLGSKALCQVIQPDPIIAVINIEMIGRSQGLIPSPFVTGASLTNLKSLFNDRLSRYDKRKYGHYFFLEDPFTEDNLFRRSDNRSFASMGIPAHTIMLTSPHDKLYHSVNDEVETIDFDIMTEVIKAIALSSEAVIDGTSVPTRIKK